MTTNEQRVLRRVEQRPRQKHKWVGEQWKLCKQLTEVSTQYVRLFLPCEADASAVLFWDRNSVLLSVRLSDACLRNEKNITAADILTPHERVITLVFDTDRQQRLGATSHSTWNLCLKWPTLFEKCRLRKIFAYNASTVHGKNYQWKVGGYFHRRLESIH